MFAYPLRTAALALTAAVGLAACTTPYGYSGVSVGVGNGYYDPYYGGYGYGYGAGYPGYGYGYGYPGYGYAYAPYWGWYDNFYYPGTGYYVYDIYRRPHRWSDAQRRYWEARRERAQATGTTSRPVVIRENWNDFSRDRTRARPVDRNSTRVERSRPIRVDRAERPQVERRSSSDRVSRQAVREQRRNEARAERASRSETRSRNKNRDE